MRRLRSKHARNHLYIQADGRCRNCGIKLPDNWHADHIIPYCYCQTTELENMQALCPTCNIKKGNKMLRKHQKELIEKLNEIVKKYKKLASWIKINCR